MSGPSVPVEPPGPPFTATVELPASLEASAELPASLEATVTVPAPGGPGAGAVSPLTLTANEPTETPLTVNNAIGQSADLLDVNAVGSNYLKVTSVGTFQQQMPAGYSDQITGMLVINPNYDPGGDQRFPGVMVSTYNYGKPGTLGLVIWATATQTADLLRTVSGPTPTVLGGIDAGGRPYYGPTASFGGGTGPMLFLANATTEPTTDPVGGGILYVSDGALKYKGLDGVVDLSAGPGVASPLTLTANEPTETPLTLTGAASQTADALVVTDSAGTTLLKVTASGSLNQPTNS
ncbi:MAG TPA: hypothetical protein VLL25_05920, partial [Acidimicrobiales bacterium]|nr:hypothetical protein [Acidimicrobiales bacterium]